MTQLSLVFENQRYQIVGVKCHQSSDNQAQDSCGPSQGGEGEWEAQECRSNNGSCQVVAA
ncbi:hypothetical protein U1Q18_032890, partial [Sarracenia purpurea var. burkii]